MSRKIHKPETRLWQCGVCGQHEDRLSSCEGGYICPECLALGRKGRDTTTRAARATKISMTEKATANMHREWGDEAGAESHEAGAAEYGEKAEALFQVTTLPKQMVGGEAIPERPMRIVNTLKAPDVANLDASAHRLQLLDLLGTDCAAMALDAADSIQAGNSLEKMLAHQLAVAHKTALEITGKAIFEQNVGDRARLLNLAVRMMETFQKGLLTLQRIRSNGEQRIVIQYVNVSDGGQAIVGTVNPGGGKK